MAAFQRIAKHSHQAEAAASSRPNVADQREVLPQFGLARVESLAPVDPPSGESPYARAIASTRVDLPDPFSPMNTVAAPSSKRSFRSCETAGSVDGHRAGSGLLSVERSTSRIGNRSSRMPTSSQRAPTLRPAPSRPAPSRPAPSRRACLFAPSVPAWVDANEHGRREQARSTLHHVRWAATSTAVWVASEDT
jgi:hypothetical protein